MWHLSLHFCFLHQSLRMLSSVTKFVFSSEVTAVAQRPSQVCMEAASALPFELLLKSHWSWWAPCAGISLCAAWMFCRWRTYTSLLQHPY